MALRGQAPTATVQTQTQTKTIRLMRHGTTHMNEYLRQKPYGSNAFVDPLYYDTRLTPAGELGAQQAAAVAQRLSPEPELLVVSPLTRALQTATAAYLPWYKGKVVVEALARERVWLASDTGRSPGELAREYPNLSFDHLPPVWWFTGGSTDRAVINLEPEEVFEKRVEEFKEWLFDRPESVIAVVAHWGLIYSLTKGVDFTNCEIRSYSLSSRNGGLVPLDDSPTKKQAAAKFSMLN